MINGGIFGTKLSGKTTLAKALSQGYAKRGRKSLVLDPHEETWGDQAEVFSDEEMFWERVWKSDGALIIVDEAAATIRRERELIPVFTRLRHLHHLLIVIGHSGMDLLPVMRQQLDEIFLFRQPESAAKVWAETFAENRLLDAATLGQFEFIQCELYHEPKRRKLDLKKRV